MCGLFETKLVISFSAGALLILLSSGLRLKVMHSIGVLLGKYVHKTHRIRKRGEPPIEYGDKESGVNDELWDDPWGYLKKVRNSNLNPTTHLLILRFHFNAAAVPSEVWRHIHAPYRQ